MSQSVAYYRKTGQKDRQHNWAAHIASFAKYNDVSVMCIVIKCKLKIKYPDKF